MSAYLSNLLTQTTSKYNSLRRTLLSTEEDGDTEDDTNLCRVLRAYYVEKGRQFPPWLPPDPHDRRSLSTPQQPYGTLNQQPSYFGGAGTRTNTTYSTTSSASTRANLSDLWDTPSAQPTPMQPTSLRNARRPQPPSNPTPTTSTLNAPRPLPSQRAGSFQNTSHQQPPQSYAPSQPQAGYTNPRNSAPGSASPYNNNAASAPGSGSAQDRLKARLWGARSGAGTPSPPASAVGAVNPYETHGQVQQQGAGGGGGGGGGYGRENPYAPGERRYGR